MQTVVIRKLFEASVVSPVTAGVFDLHACLNRNELLRPQERKIIPCGISVDIPPGFCLALVPRPGLSVRHGITIHNSPAILSAGDSGELRVVLHNDGKEVFSVFPGACIASAVFLPIMAFTWSDK